MAAEGQTVVVRGLPVDVQEDRLRDKLNIHFLRPRNGGGEIASISIAKATATSALIAFEESEVAQRVVQWGKHILSVDNKDYKLTVSLHSKGVDPDKVFVGMTVTVDYSQLPQGMATLTDLHQNFPNVHLRFIQPEHRCAVTGLYSEVLALVTHALELLEGQTSTDFQQTPNHADLTYRETSCPREQLAEHCLGIDRQKQHIPQPTVRDPGSASSGKDYKGRPEEPSEGQDQAELTKQQPQAEICSLNMSSDAVSCIQKRCSQEHRPAMTRHSTEVVDTTTQDPATLLLQARRGLARLAEERVWQREGEPGRLYKENKPLCEEQSSTKLWSPQRMSKEVKLATTFRDPKSQVTGEDNQEARPSKAVVSEDAPKYLSSYESDAMFFSKDRLYGAPVLGDWQKTNSEMFGTEAKKFSVKDEMSSPLWTGDNITFKQVDIPCSAPAGGPLLGPPFMYSQSNMGHSNLFRKRAVEATALPPAGPRPLTTLRRASSFTGPVRPTQESKEDKDEDAPGATASRARPTSLRSKAEKRHGHSAEVVLSKDMWYYMKKAYEKRLGDIISSLHVTESPSEKELTVQLKARSSSAAETSQRELTKLVAMVATDFCVHELPLAHLGLADSMDETLEMCCDEARQKFQKILIRVEEKRLVITGPKLLCSRVSDSLMEVFGSGTKEKKSTGEAPVTPVRQCPAALSGQTETRYGRIQKGGEGPRVSGRKSKTQPVNDCVHRITNNVGSERKGKSKLGALKEPMVKEKVGGVVITEEKDHQHDASRQMETRWAHRTESPPTSVCTTALDQTDRSKQKSTPAQTAWSKHQGTKHLTHYSSSLLEKSLAHGNKDLPCHCGVSGCSMMGPECGLSLLPESQVRGIRGSISYNKLPVGLPGYSSHKTLQITYSIPDGIQEESHPNPGSPFQGGVFEAYLPFSTDTLRLLPQLESAFSQGLTFTVTAEDRVAWSGLVPHKTRKTEGSTGHHYPDSKYIAFLSRTLKGLSLEEATSTEPQANKVTAGTAHRHAVRR